jgi:hypothetical protein
MSFQRIEHRRDERLEPLPANAIRGFPENQQRLGDRVAVVSTTGCRPARSEGEHRFGSECVGNWFQPCLKDLCT